MNFLPQHSELKFQNSLGYELSHIPLEYTGSVHPHRTPRHFPNPAEPGIGKEKSWSRGKVVCILYRRGGWSLDMRLQRSLYLMVHFYRRGFEIFGLRGGRFDILEVIPLNLISSLIYRSETKEKKKSKEGQWGEGTIIGNEFNPKFSD